MGRQRLEEKTDERQVIRGKLEELRKRNSAADAFGVQGGGGANTAGPRTHRAASGLQLAGTTCVSPVSCSPRPKPDKSPESNPPLQRQKTNEKNKSQIDLSDGQSNQSQYQKTSLRKQRKRQEHLRNQESTTDYETGPKPQISSKVKAQKLDWKSREENLRNYS